MALRAEQLEAQLEKSLAGLYVIHGDEPLLALEAADAIRAAADEVMDGPQSLVFAQAENRLHAQKAILARLFGVA